MMLACCGLTDWLGRRLRSSSNNTRTDIEEPDTYSVQEPLLESLKVPAPSYNNQIPPEQQVLQNELSQLTYYVKQQRVHWLDNTLYITMQRIKTAVDKDKLERVDPRYTHSSSACDLMSMFYQIKEEIWRNLDVTDHEARLKHGSKLVDDLCRCAVTYADEMKRKMDRECKRAVDPKGFRLTPQWCVAVCDIEYVRQSIPRFVATLGLDEDAGETQQAVDGTQQAVGRTQQAVDRTQQAVDGTQQAVDRTQQAVDRTHQAVDRTLRVLDFRVQEPLDTACEKMGLKVKSYLVRHASAAHHYSDAESKLLTFLDRNLQVLRANVCDKYEDYILCGLWDGTLGHLRAIATQAPPDAAPLYFELLHDVWKDLQSYFRANDKRRRLRTETASDVERLLVPRAVRTAQYIHLYHAERLAQQVAQETAHLGTLAVRMQLVRRQLRVHVLNGSDLRPRQTRDTCNPYLTVQLLPREVFKDVPKIRTKTHRGTVFPLFDKAATVCLTSEQCVLDGALVRFAVKEKGVFRVDCFLGEAFAPFRDIPVTDKSVRLQDLEQVVLKLSLPTTSETHAFRALEQRSHDKTARAFVKKERRKMLARAC